jgi:glycosyltransferase involved in cell wall biosynthesis
MGEGVIVSIVVPTLNEEKYLPRLLESLNWQTVTDFEVIVADAASQDGTLEVVRQWDCVLAPGGRPAQGRNHGAGLAQGQYLLFLDADVTVPPTFIEDLLGNMEQKQLAVASGFIIPDSRRPVDHVLLFLSNWYHFLLQLVSPHASGFYIAARKTLHDRIGGFNEEVWMAEDHDYVVRAARHGKFRYLRHPRVRFSTRRFDKEGRARLLWKFFVMEMYRAFFTEIRRENVHYEFGKF